RVRALLAAADEPAYRETVAALAGCRDGARRRVVVSYLVPTEAGWAAECAERSGPNSPQNAALHSMLLCSLGSPEQIALIGGGIGLQWRGVPMDVAATLAEGVGPAFAPLLGRDLKGRYVGTDAVKQVMNVLSQLPGDEAFGILLEHADDKHARTALSAAARRFPVRALRMLAEASLGEDGGAAVARQLL
ncbi:MolR family transcriptional regulator, partial [Streptomyces sp. DJ]